MKKPVHTQDQDQEETVLESEPETEDIEFEDDILEEVGSADKIRSLRNQIQTLTQERNEYLTGWQKAKADYINFKNEQDRLKSEMKGYIQSQCVDDLMPVLDSFEMAMKGEAWQNVDANWRIGVEYIFQQLQTVLKNYGVDEIKEVGIAFDPRLHEPVEIVDAENGEKSDQIQSIIQKGYKMGETIIRPAKVKVTR